MTTSLNSVELQALELSPAERVALADRLLLSVAPSNEFEEAWAVEIDRRLAEIDAGRMQLVPLDEALERARQSLR